MNRSYNNLSYEELLSLIDRLNSSSEEYNYRYNVTLLEASPVKLPFEILSEIAQYKDHITTSEDLKFLSWLDPSNRIAKRVLKSDTGLDLLPDEVLQLLEFNGKAKGVNLTEHLKDLISLRLYYPSLNFFRQYFHANFYSPRFSWLVPTLQELVYLAFENHDFQSTDYYQLLNSSYNPTRGLSWWLINGDKEQKQFVASITE